MNVSKQEWRALALRWSGELAIIVIGVTIALWADSWVTERGNQQKATATLGALLANVNATQADLQRTIDNADGARDSLARLAAASPGDLSESESYDLMFYGLLYGPDFAPELNVYDDLKSSGDLALLTTTEVRQSLARMEAQLARVRILEDDLNVVQATNIDLYLVDHLDLRRLYDDDLGVDFTRKDAADDSDHSIDTRLRNRILLKLDIVLFALKEYRILEMRITEVRQAIEANLNNGG